MTDGLSPNNPPKTAEKALDPVALVLLDCLANLPRGETAAPRDIAVALAERRRKAKDPVDLWRKFLPAVKQQGLYLARHGRIEILRRGQAVDPEKPIKGLVRYRLA